MWSNTFYFKVADIVLKYSNDDRVLVETKGFGHLFFCDSSIGHDAYDVQFACCNYHDFPVGQSLYSGLPWGDIKTDYLWFVENIDDKIAIKVKFDGHDSLVGTMALIDSSNKKITIYIDSKEYPIVFDPFLYPLGILMLIYLVHIKKGFIIHASGVSDGDNGYLFTGLSGIGKSTMARLWEQSGATIVNDDRLAVMPSEQGFDIYNTPMPYYEDVPKSVHLKGIFLLKQSLVNTCNPISGATAMMRLMANCIQHLHSEAYVNDHLAIVEAIMAKVPLFELGFKPDEDVVTLIRNLKL